MCKMKGAMWVQLEGAWIKCLSVYCNEDVREVSSKWERCISGVHEF